MIATLTAFIISLLFALFVGNIMGFIIGVIAFFMSFMPSLKFAIALDFGAWVYRDHHNRNNIRAQRGVESLAVIEQNRHKNTIKEIILDNYLKSKPFE